MTKKRISHISTSNLLILCIMIILVESSIKNKWDNTLTPLTMRSTYIVNA